MLICFSPQHSHAVYLDSESVKKKDYKYIMRVLDDALVGYIKAGGKIMKHKFRKNQPDVNVFSHVTQFTCVKKPAGSVRDAYYALHHMRAIVQEQRNLTDEGVTPRLLQIGLPGVPEDRRPMRSR